MQLDCHSATPNEVSFVPRNLNGNGRPIHFSFYCHKGYSSVKITENILAEQYILRDGHFMIAFRYMRVFVSC